MHRGKRAQRAQANPNVKRRWIKGGYAATLNFESECAVNMLKELRQIRQLASLMARHTPIV